MGRLLFVHVFLAQSNRLILFLTSARKKSALRSVRSFDCTFSSGSPNFWYSRSVDGDRVDPELQVSLAGEGGIASRIGQLPLRLVQLHEEAAYLAPKPVLQPLEALSHVQLPLL